MMTLFTVCNYGSTTSHQLKPRRQMWVGNALLPASLQHPRLQTVFSSPEHVNNFSGQVIVLMTPFLLTRPSGRPISPNDLFNYSNGRFLINEQHELSRRHVMFDLERLCAIVSSLPSILSPVSSIDKHEGGFNKALTVTMMNGKEVVVKIPFPAMVPTRYGVELEVATLKFVRDTTSIPVPDVLAWSSDPSNPVGAEYMVLEKCPGRQLHTVWGELDELRRFKLVKSMAGFDSQLASVRFPGYGSLYLRASGAENALPIDTAKDPATDPAKDVKGIYCLGPAFNDFWLRNPGPRKDRDIAGPWTDLCAFGLAKAKQGSYHVANTNYLGARGPHFGSNDSHLHHLEAAMKMIPILANTPLLQRHARPTLWHSDLHMGNIFVAEDDPTEVVGVIDWQFISILPAFTQVRWPRFLEPPEDYETGAIKPELPSDFETMDPDEMDYAISQRDQAMQAKCYEFALSQRHRDSYLALTKVHDTIRRLFTLCERTYKDGVLPLRDCLIQLSINWQTIGLGGSCPFVVSTEELIAHETQLAEYQDWVKLRKYTQEILYSDEEGWVPPELNFDAIRAQEQQLLEIYLRRRAPDMSEEDAGMLWFYNERR